MRNCGSLTHLLTDLPEWFLEMLAHLKIVSLGVGWLASSQRYIGNNPHVNKLVSLGVGWLVSLGGKYNLEQQQQQDERRRRWWQPPATQLIWDNLNSLQTRNSISGFEILLPTQYILCQSCKIRGSHGNISLRKWPKQGNSVICYGVKASFRISFV